MSIPFTQFLLPSGQKRHVEIDRDTRIESMSQELIRLGCRFEIEVLQTRQINMETLDASGSLICGEICDNGPAVPEMVDKMITNAYEKTIVTLRN